jgi:signal transduction histidine kinase
MASAVAEVDRMKSEFVTIASHELRTPIHAMMLGVSGIVEGYSGEISEEVREDLKIVNEGITRLKTLVEGLLDLSRIEARKIELNITKESLVHIIDHAIEELKHIIEIHRHVINVNIPPDIPDLHVDAKRITQVVINLLSNSIKYTPDGGNIRIWAEKNTEEIIFSIADNGYGIPYWAHEKVFQEFFQADSIMSQKVGGSGLGLKISKGIIEEHRGRIYFESPIPENRFFDFPLGDQRKGTVFTIHLPIEQVVWSDNVVNKQTYE